MIYDEDNELEIQGECEKLLVHKKCNNNIFSLALLEGSCDPDET